MNARALLPLAALALGLALRPALAQSPALTDIGTGLPRLSYGDTAWGDYDGDGDLDLALTGFTGSAFVTEVYRNDGGEFVALGAGLPGVADGTIAWGDFDGDNDLDLVFNGQQTALGAITRVYRNNGGTFADTGFYPFGIAYGASGWGDYDGDGDLDLAIVGNTTQVFQNTGGTFALVATLPPMNNSALAWGDYDGDGDADLTLSGDGGGSLGRVTRVYYSSAGTFVDAALGLPGVVGGALAWGDYDNDGDLDLAISGDAGGSGGLITRVYRNTGGVLTDISAGLPGLFYSALAWGDYDGDGDLDLAISGDAAGSGGLITRVYRNDAGTFTNAALGLPGVRFGALAWGDYNRDGDLDLAISGDTYDGFTARVYRSTGAAANAAPSAPVAPTASVGAGTVTLSWGAAADATTPAAALTYNVYLRTAGGVHYVLTPMADGGGRRLLPARGNVGTRRSLTVSVPPGTAFEWGVQAVDQGFAASAFVGGAFESPPFVATGLNLGYAPLVTWGDYDGDGDLDCVRKASEVYRNDGGAFVSDATFPDYSNTNFGAAWGDADGDGDLDLARAFSTVNSTGNYDGSYVRVYRNDDGVFQHHLLSIRLSIGQANSVAWGDYDGDGDLDLAYSNVSGANVTRVYRNDGAGAFTDTGIELAPTTTNGGLAWGDYDNDGDADLALAGRPSRIYRNDGGTLTDLAAGLPNSSYGGLDWGDYDNDGDLDLVLTGTRTSLADLNGYYARVYRNDGGVFTDGNAGLPRVFGFAGWGDYDADGDLDLAFTPINGFDSPAYTQIQRNDGGVFAQAATFAGVSSASDPWVDLDGDGDLDLSVTGNSTLTVYRNEVGRLNAPPTAPTGLTAAVSDDVVTLSWAAASDDTTPAATLSYNVYVVAPDGARFVVPPQALAEGTPADPGTVADGHRQVLGPGNAGVRRSYTLRLPRGAAYRWGVQAVDQGFAGSPFATAAAVPSGTPLDTLTLSGAPGWRMLAPPRSGLTYDSLLGPLWTQGFPGSDDPSAQPSACNVFTFDETVRTDTDGDGRISLHDGWTCLADQTAAWPVGTGLMVYVYEDDNADGTVTADEAFPKRLPLTGEAERAPYSGFALSFTDTATTPHGQEGWNLVGNPLAYAFAWGRTLRSAHVDATLHLYDPTFNGGDYRAHTAGVGGDLAGGVVPPGQGFFVKVHGASPTLAIPYEAVGVADPPFFGRTRGRTTTDTPGTPGEPGGPAQTTGSGTVAGEGDAPALTLALESVRPNPARGVASLTYAIPATAPVRLTLYDMLGRAVAVLAEGERPAGRHTVALDASALAPGVYVLRLAAGADALTRRLTIEH